MLWPQMFTADWQPVSRIAEIPTTQFGVVDTNYLRIMGTTLAAGRDFAKSDTAESLPVALVNETFVRRYFAQENPIGRKIPLGPPKGLVPLSQGDAGSGAGSMTVVGVVGVVGNFLNAGTAMPVAPQILPLFGQQPI
jgi:hypothetical protein